MQLHSQSIYTNLPPVTIANTIEADTTARSVGKVHLYRIPLKANIVLVAEIEKLAKNACATADTCMSNRQPARFNALAEILYMIAAESDTRLLDNIGIRLLDFIKNFRKPWRPLNV